MVQKVKRIIWIIKNLGYWIEEKKDKWLFGFIEYIWNKWFTDNMKWAFGREVVTDIMEKRINENRLYIKRTDNVNKILGDPCPGTFKIL